MRLLILWAGLTLLTLSTALAADPTATPASSEKEVLFDDFNYAAPDDLALSDNGWIVRTDGDSQKINLQKKTPDKQVRTGNIAKIITKNSGEIDLSIIKS